MTTETYRPIVALPISSVVPNIVNEDRPAFRWVDPTTLLVEEAYQRDLGERSFKMIRKIVGGWDWKAMKPPICSVGPNGSLVVIDGQHTAIAAASHPNISEIPVMVVNAVEVADRASAFVKHNSERIAMTSMQVHHAALAANDEVAVAMGEACRKSGARILRNPPAQGAFKVGDTVAVATIHKITSQKGAHFMGRVLRILVQAMRAPVTTAEIHAISLLLSDPAWKGSILEEDLALLVRSRTAKDWIAHAEINVRKGMKMPMSRALAIDWFKIAPKRRRTA